MKPGDLISRYRIAGPLGRGGMGVVYRAEDSRLHRPVALKFLPGDSITEQDKQRFLNEARIAAAARHPNICPIYDVDEDAGRLFIAMALIEGQTLQQRLSTGLMTVQQAVAFAVQIANGLAYAHAMGIVHRDIKCGNVMVDPAGHVSIMDFGLALRPDTARLTGEGRTVGTPGYMSPEQAQGREVDGRSDIWSLGVVLYEMLTGQLPFPREHTAAIVHAIIYEPAPSVASLHPGVPPRLAAVIDKALAKRPEDRWQTAGEMAAALQGFDKADVTETMAIETAPVRRRSRWVFVAAGAVVATIAGAAWMRYAWRPAFPVSNERQVAVLPFQIATPDEGTQTVSDGLEEVLTDAISGRGGLIAVPVGEIRRRRISSVQEARRIYGVAYAVTGSVTRADSGKLAFTLNVTDAGTSKATGSEKFVYDPADPINSRDKAVAAELAMLKVKAEPTPRNTPAAVNAGAFESYLRGRGLLVRFDLPGNVDKARALFEGAVRADPNYALAWAGLAEAESQRARSSGDKEWSMAAIRDAEHAVKLDDSLAVGHAVLGRVYASAGREEEAIRELRRAIEISPGNAEAPRELARVYNNLGRFKEAEASYLQATAARPTDWYAHMLLGLFYYGRERYADATSELEKARQLTPDNENVTRNLGGMLTIQGRYAEAVQQYQHALQVKGDALTYAALGSAYFYEHRYAEAATAVETAIDLDSRTYAFWGNAGVYYKWIRGSEQKSAPSLQRAVELGLKALETRPTDYEIRADLAEYYARLGDARAALAELDRIPSTARKPLAARIAIVYELTGRRADAIRAVAENLTTAASLNQIRDDPDLTTLWNTPEIRRLSAAVR